MKEHAILCPKCHRPLDEDVAPHICCAGTTALALPVLRQGQRRLRISLRRMPAVRRRTRAVRAGPGRRCSGDERRAQGIRDRAWRSGVLPSRRRKRVRPGAARALRALRRDGARAHGHAGEPLPRRPRRRCSMRTRSSTPSFSRASTAVWAMPRICFASRSTWRSAPRRSSKRPPRAPRPDRRHSGCTASWRRRNASTPRCFEPSRRAGARASRACSARRATSRRRRDRGGRDDERRAGIAGRSRRRARGAGLRQRGDEPRRAS